MSIVSTYNVNAQVADFQSNKTEGCLPLSGVNFTDMSTGGTVISRSWNLGNGTIINNAGPVVGTNYLTDGTFIVRLTVTFASGEVRTKEIPILVHPRPIANFSASEKQGCIPLLTQFTDLSTTKTGSIVSHIWDFGAGGTNVSNPPFSFTSNGNYNITLLVKNSWGCESEAHTKPAYIKVFPKPVASFSMDERTSCEVPLTTNFTNTTTGDGEITYLWNFGNGQSSTDKNPSTEYISSGAYRVTLTAQNGPGCISTLSTNTSTDIYAGTPEVMIDAPSTACANTTVSFNASVQPTVFVSTYKWTFSDGTIRTGRNPSHTFSIPGTYTVQVEAFNQAGCSSVDDHTITIQPAPSAVFTVDRTTGCQVPFNVQFTPNTSSPNLSYSWTFGDGDVSSDEAPVHAYTRTGYYTVRLTVKDLSVTDGCAAIETRTNLIYIAKPVVDYTYTPPVGCLPLPVKFTARVTSLVDPIAKYEWTFGDGNTIVVNTPEYTHTYTAEGVFNALLTIETQSGCRETSTLKPVSVIALCDDDGSGGGGGGGGAGFGVGKDCEEKYTVTLSNMIPNTEVISWDFGDGSPASTILPLETVTHIFPETAKDYIVTVTRRNLLTSEEYTAQKRVIIIDEKANFIPTLTNICAGKAVQFNPVGINSANIRTYTWDFGDGSARRNINNQAYFDSYGIYLDGSTSYTFNTNGTYPVKLIITDKLGCKDSILYTTPIEVKSPEANFTMSQLASCDEEFDITFTDASIPNGSTAITSWNWNMGDGTIVNAVDNSKQQHSYNNQSYYRVFTVNLKVVDAIGCESQVSKTIKGYRPKADFSSNDVLTCGKMNVYLSNNSSAYNATYEWDFGDGTTASGSSQSHTYTADGAYTITLMATDENGCTSTTTKRNYINLVKPKAEFKIADSSKCAPVALILADSSEYAYTYAWDFGDGGTGTTDKDPAPHIYALPGLYDITLRIKGVGGCESSITKTVRIKGPIGVMEQGAIVGCAPFVANLKVTGANIDTYTWDLGDGTIIQPSDNDFIVAHTYASSGKFLPNVVLSSPEGCLVTLKAKDSILVDDAHAAFAIDRYDFCDTGSIRLTNKSSFPFEEGNYHWDFGDQLSSDDKNPETHFYKDPGLYTVTLYAVSPNNCMDVAVLNMPVTIYKPPVINVPGSMEQCAEASRVFDAVIQSDDKVIAYNWLVNDVKEEANKPLERSFPLAGAYEVKLAVSTEYGCLDTLIKLYTVHPLPVPAAAPDTIVCAGSTVPLRVQHINNQQYQWSQGALLNNPLIHNPVASPPGNTRFHVQVTNQFGCIQIDSVDVQVDKKVQLVTSDDAIICLGDRVRLNASGHASRFLWSPASGLSNPAIASPMAAPVQTTNYQVIGYSDNVCPDEMAGVLVTVGSIPQVDLGLDKVVRAGTKVLLQPTVTSDVVAYTWTPMQDLSCWNCAAPSFFADKDVSYRVTVRTQYNCTASDEIKVKVLCGSDAVYIPNSFTPNGDGINDIFYIKGYGIKTVKRFQIFDRWGKLVFNAADFSPNDPSKGWNGWAHGKRVATSTTFVYFVEAECREGGTLQFKGTVTAVR